MMEAFADYMPSLDVSSRFSGQRQSDPVKPVLHVDFLRSALNTLDCKEELQGGRNVPLLDSHRQQKARSGEPASASVWSHSALVDQSAVHALSSEIF